MAYVPNLEVDAEELKRRQETLTRATAPGPESAPTASGGGAPAPNRPRGSGFVNLEKYLAMNEGAGSSMGQQIAGEADKVGAEAERQIQNAQTQFRTQAGQAVPTVTPRTFSAKEVDRKSPSYIMDIMYGPKAVATKEELDALKAASEAGYKGPKSLKDVDAYAGAASATSRARRGAGELDNENVRQDILSRGAVGRSGYTQGQRGLDSFLASQSKGGQSAIRGSRAKWANIDQMLGGAEAGATAEGKSAEQKAKDAAAQAGRQLAQAQAAQARQNIIWENEKKYQEEMAKRAREEWDKKKPIDKVGNNWSVLASDWNVGP